MSRRIRRMTVTALMTALLCIAGPMTLPVGPIPLSLGSLVVMLLGMILGAAGGLQCCGLYLLLGTLGLPVFAGFTGGVMALLGPTGGFLLGYLPLVLICGWRKNADRSLWRNMAACIAGHLCLYLMGTLWYHTLTGCTAVAAISVCVLPFLPGDAVKIVAAVKLGPALHSRLRHAGAQRA